MPKPPQADAGVNCPFYKQDVSEVCHRCHLYVLIRGKNPQTGEDVDTWGCTFAFFPMLMLENSQVNRGVGAAIESFRNEMVKANEQLPVETKLKVIQ